MGAQRVSNPDGLLVFTLGKSSVWSGEVKRGCKFFGAENHVLTTSKLVAVKLVGKSFLLFGKNK